MSTKKDLPQDNDSNEMFPDFLLGADLSSIDPKVIAVINERIANYRQQLSQVEPVDKKVGPWRMYIETRDIMLMKRKSRRFAQRVLQNTRILLNKKPRADITVTEFCVVNGQNEDHVRVCLNIQDEADAKRR